MTLRESVPVQVNGTAGCFPFVLVLGCNIVFLHYIIFIGKKTGKI